MTRMPGGGTTMLRTATVAASAARRTAPVTPAQINCSLRVLGHTGRHAGTMARLLLEIATADVRSDVVTAAATTADRCSPALATTPARVSSDGPAGRCRFGFGDAFDGRGAGGCTRGADCWRRASIGGARIVG